MKNGKPDEGNGDWDYARAEASLIYGRPRSPR